MSLSADGDTGGWTGPIALAPLSVRHRMKTNAIKRMALVSSSTNDGDNNKNRSLEDNDDELAHSSRTSTTTASSTGTLVPSAGHQNLASSSSPPKPRPHPDSTETGCNESDENADENSRAPSSLSCSASSSSGVQATIQNQQIGLLAATWSKPHRQQPQQQLQHKKQQQQHLQQRTTQIISSSASNAPQEQGATFHRWNHSDATAQTMLMDHFVRDIQKKVARSDGETENKKNINDNNENLVLQNEQSRQRKEDEESEKRGLQARQKDNENDGDNDDHGDSGGVGNVDSGAYYYSPEESRRRYGSQGRTVLRLADNDDNHDETVMAGKEHDEDTNEDAHNFNRSQVLADARRRRRRWSLVPDLRHEHPNHHHHHRRSGQNKEHENNKHPTENDVDFHHKLRFTSVQDPLQSFLFMRLTNLPFQISNATVRRKLLLEADRTLYGKNAGSVFLLGPEAAAARDKVRDAERLADPAFGFVEGIDLVESEDDEDNADGDGDGGADEGGDGGYDYGNDQNRDERRRKQQHRASASAADDDDDTMSLGDGLESLIDGSNRRRSSSSIADRRRSSASAARRQSFIDNFLGKGVPGGSGDGGAGASLTFEQQQRIKREAVLPRALTSEWIKSQTRIMVAGILFGLDTAFGERQVGDKSYERSNRIRSLFQRNDALAELVSQCVALMFGAIGAIMSAEDIVLTLSNDLDQWPQLLMSDSETIASRSSSSASGEVPQQRQEVVVRKHFNENSNHQHQSHQSSRIIRYINDNSDIRRLYGLEEEEEDEENSTSTNHSGRPRSTCSPQSVSLPSHKQPQSPNDKNLALRASFGATEMVTCENQQEDLQRQADHEALVRALEKRFGLGSSAGPAVVTAIKTSKNGDDDDAASGNEQHQRQRQEQRRYQPRGVSRTNPIQAACDRAGIWVSMSQPRAPAAPAHVTISDRMSTYVSSDLAGKSSSNSDRGNAASQKQLVLGFGVPSDDDWSQTKRRNAMKQLATSFAATLRTFLERASNPQFFREASQALASVVATASCRIFDDIRSRAFKEVAKTKKRQMLQQMANTSRDDFLEKTRSGVLEPTDALSEATLTTLTTTTSRNNGNATAPTQSRYLSASDLNRQLGEHWSTSTKAVHRHLLQCRRELVFLLSGVDSYKPTYRPRAGEELVPIKHVVAAGSDSANSNTNNDNNSDSQQRRQGSSSSASSPASTTTTTTTRTMIPAWGQGLSVLRRHPRLQWMLKLSEVDEVDTKAERFALPKNVKSKQEQNKNKSDSQNATTGDGAGESSTASKKQQTVMKEGWFLKKNENQSSNANTSNKPHQENGENRKTTGNASSFENAEPDDDDDEASTPRPDDGDGSAKNIKNHKHPSTSLPPSLSSSATKKSPSNNGVIKKPISPPRSPTKLATTTSTADAASSAENDDEDRFKKAVTFVEDALILRTGAHSGHIESLTGEKRLRTPLLSWQKMEDGSTTVRKCDVATLKRTVARDVKNKKSSGGDQQQQQQSQSQSQQQQPRRLSRGNSMDSAMEGSFMGSFLMSNSGSFSSFSTGHGGSFSTASNRAFGSSGRMRSDSVSSFRDGDSFTIGRANSIAFGSNQDGQMQLLRSGGSAGSPSARLENFLAATNSASPASASPASASPNPINRQNKDTNNNDNDNNSNNNSNKNNKNVSSPPSLSPTSLRLLNEVHSSSSPFLLAGREGSQSEFSNKNNNSNYNTAGKPTNEKIYYIPPFASYTQHAGTFVTLRSALASTRSSDRKKQQQQPFPQPFPQPQQLATAIFNNNSNNNPAPITSPTAATARSVKFGRLPLTARSQRRKLFGENSDLQPKNLRFALRAILHDVTENASELHAAAVEAAQDSKSMQRQRSDLRTVRAGRGGGGGGASFETEPVAVVADSIARTYQKVRQQARAAEEKKRLDAEKQVQRKRRWQARQLERQFGAEEGILSVDGGADFAIAVRRSDYDGSRRQERRTKKALKLLVGGIFDDNDDNDDDHGKNNEYQNDDNDDGECDNDDDDDDDDEQQQIDDLYKKPPSVWDEPEEPHPLMYSSSASASASASATATDRDASKKPKSASSPLRRCPGLSSQQQQQHQLNTEKAIPLLRNVIESVPASRAALIHAYAQARSDSFSNRTRGDRQPSGTAGSGNVDSYLFSLGGGNLRSSVDNRRVDAAIRKYEAKRAEELESRMQRGQDESTIPVAGAPSPSPALASKRPLSLEQQNGAFSPQPPQTARPVSSSSPRATTATVTTTTAANATPRNVLSKPIQPGVSATPSSKAPRTPHPPPPPVAMTTTTTTSDTKAPPPRRPPTSSAKQIPQPQPLEQNQQPVPTPWYSQGLPKHRMSLVDQREAPFGRFHLAQGSPLLMVGMHSTWTCGRTAEVDGSNKAKKKKGSGGRGGDDDHNQEVISSSSSSMHHRAGRRDVKWTLV